MQALIGVQNGSNTAGDFRNQKIVPNLKRMGDPNVSCRPQAKSVSRARAHLRDGAVHRLYAIIGAIWNAFVGISCR